MALSITAVNNRNGASATATLSVPSNYNSSVVYRQVGDTSEWVQAKLTTGDDAVFIGEPATPPLEYNVLTAELQLGVGNWVLKLIVENPDTGESDVDICLVEVSEDVNSSAYYRVVALKMASGSNTKALVVERIAKPIQPT